MLQYETVRILRVQGGEVDFIGHNRFQNKWRKVTGTDLSVVGAGTKTPAPTTPLVEISHPDSVSASNGAALVDSVSVFELLVVFARNK